MTFTIIKKKSKNKGEIHKADVLESGTDSWLQKEHHEGKTSFRV